MKEARILLPGSIDFDFISECIDKWGGVTTSKCAGYWKNPKGVVIQDINIAYDIAMINLEYNKEILRALAIKYGKKLKEEAVYVRYSNGEVEIIKVTE